MTVPVQEIETDRLDKLWKYLGLRKLLAWQDNIFLSQITTGYDESVVRSFQSMKPRVKDMENPDPSKIKLIAAIHFVGGFVGALVASPTFNVLWYVGSIIAAWATFGTGYMSTSWSWPILSLIQGVPAIFVMLSVLYGLPKSPQWLAKYHGDLHSALVIHEMEEIHALLGAEAAAQKSGQNGWSILYRSLANMKRITLVGTVTLLTL
ncbi:hypothetical protein N7447_010679 [Penicillium robsamsonii]|uniref:uncharacterized protein n=1 Tax=Penicillium robsamsonii TaxID=1792511 RepID=UPI0025499FE8|nr:uncharacterized protein N7447_010679 [Penicillium robsamsonii]KAJ5811163.1 hypothetical protein N7447_010679 [Penicillium robsamsonii]